MTGVSVFSIIAIAVLLFGSVETWSIALVGFVTAGSFVSFAWKKERFEGDGMKPLFVALTLTPMLAARMKPPRPRAHGSIYHRLEQAFAITESVTIASISGESRV